jgi:hypothetical protein
MKLLPEKLFANKRLKRFFVFAFWATAFVIAIMVLQGLLAVYFDDSEVAPTQSEPFIERLCEIMAAIAVLPWSAELLISDKFGINPPAVVSFVLLFGSGLFWACVIELLLLARKRLLLKKAAKDILAD